jgi:predicted GH43/DUF377 family glycosyl hydrolase/CheY-like chemotaxis protein
MKDRNGDLNLITPQKKLLIGAFFTSEYSIESAAFFNPSIIEDPDQSGLQLGERRVIFSFRATGEGHISSIVFRGGVLDAQNNLKMVTTGRLVDEAETIRNQLYRKDGFIKKLEDMLADQRIVNLVMSKLPDEFDYAQLAQAIEDTHIEINPDVKDNKVLQIITWLGDSHYEIFFSLDTGISDRVIFPLAATESNGIEDARFVKFTGDDGIECYYATYTAYNGHTIMPKLIETKDFYSFKIKPIHGDLAQNKGMALFPRKIKGQYAMLSRIDGINSYMMLSDRVNVWNSAKIIQFPKFPWEFIQVGNCGSPIETEYGWLVITHGVGPMRRYVLGAILLDLDDPTIVIGQLSEPLISPTEEEREGYVPNVVYSCGSMINGNELIIPYAMSDTSSTYATVSLKELLTNLAPSALKKGTEPATVPKHRILVVEDEEVNQKLIADYLKSAGYSVETASDGIIALMKIAKDHFDLILSDISMPNLDGYQLLAYMKSNGMTVPVVFLSSAAGKEEIEKGLSLGAVEYITKPVEKATLIKSLSRILPVSGN